MAVGWEAVAIAVRTRRLDLGLRQNDAAERANVSIATWRLIESGGRDRYQDLTLRGVARALEWPPDAISRIHDGDVDLSHERDWRVLEADVARDHHAREPAPNPDDVEDTEIEIDFNTVVPTLPEHIQRAMRELVRGYLNEAEDAG